jgi:hypothetical protein
MPFDNPHQTPFGDIELLTDARNRISAREAWVQGGFRKKDRYCLVGALSLTSGSRRFDKPNMTERRLARVLAAQLPSTGPFLTRVALITARQRLILFNDSSTTSHEDVMALFDRTICHLANKAPVCTSA